MNSPQIELQHPQRGSARDTQRQDASMGGLAIVGRAARPRARMARALQPNIGAASFYLEESHMPSKTDEPMWWSRAHLSSWERVREAVRRDWQQTKHDLLLRGGHELHQSMGDTVRQAIGRESIPANDRPNPPHTIGEWEDIERAIRFGYAARGHYGSLYPIWSRELETSLARDWDRTENGARQRFDEARRWVRKGYERTGTH